MENYFAAKALLFTNLDREENPGAAVINLDDAYGVKLMHLLANSQVRMIPYTVQGAAGAEIEARDIVSTAMGTEGTLRIGNETYAFALPLIGSYNVANALAAVGGALALGIAPHVIIRAAARYASGAWSPGEICLDGRRHGCGRLRAYRRCGAQGPDGFAWHHEGTPHRRARAVGVIATQ